MMDNLLTMHDMYSLHDDHKAIVNEDTSGSVLQLQAEIKKLKVALENARG